MKKLIFAVLMFPAVLFAEDTILNLNLGDSVMATCIGEGTGPGNKDDYATHGPTHQVAVKLGYDCRECHGADLRGTSRSVTSKPRGCMAPDGFVPPAGNPKNFVIDPWGVSFNPRGTSAALYGPGVVVGCHNCHAEVEIKVDGREIEFEFREEFDDDD